MNGSRVCEFPSSRVRRDSAFPATNLGGSAKFFGGRIPRHKSRRVRQSFWRTHSAFPGFSLIEVVIAMGILAVGLVGAIRVFPVGLRASQRAEWLSRASLVAERTLEPLKLKSWDELEAGQTTSVEDPFNVVLSIDQPAVEGLIDPSRLKRLAVTVSWMQEGRLRSITMVSYVHHQAS